MWDALGLDVRYSFRSLRRAPGFSLIVIATLMVAVGATAAVGSLLNAIVLRRLAVPSPGQLVAVSTLDPRTNVSGYFYADTFKAYRAVQRSFAQLSMYSGGGLARVEARSGASEDASTETVSPDYVDIVGARLSAGRFFTETDDAVAVISEDFRRRLFGSGPAIGEPIKIDAVPATVIGVIADGFGGLQSDATTDIIVPFAVRRAAVGDPSLPFRSSDVVGRLARGVSIDAARAELLARWPPIQSATLPAMLPDADREALLRQRLEVEPLASGFSGLRPQYGPTLWLLLALMGILLAIACANLTGLTLARSLTRRREIMIRLALGGRPLRVFWQLLVDGILLSGVAFAGAIALAWWIVRALTAELVVGRRASSFPEVTPDARVLAATALLTLVIGLAIGVVSAWQSVAVRLDEGLRGRGIAGSLGRFGRSLLIAQVALSMTLLVSAGVLVSTLAHLRANDTSLQSQRIFFTRAFRQPGDRQLLPPGYYEALVTGLAQIPGADAAALSVYYPTYYGLKAAPLPTDYHYTLADGVTPLDATVLTEFVSPGFFDLFRFSRLSGRDVSWDDGLDKPAVALLSASLARALFPAGDAVGQHVRIAGPERREIEIIGVVADAPYARLDDPHPLVVFRPIMQEVARAQFPMAYVRATGDVATVRDGYTRVIKSLGHRSLRPFFTTSSAWVDIALLQERFTAGLAAFAAAITIVLACMGVYGLLAYSVTARVREIGVRVALGATRPNVVWMIVRDGLAIAIPGVLIGALCAWAAARLVRAQLYGIAPGDPRTLLIAAVILVATVFTASLLPALRASRVVPLDALREE